MRTKLGEKKEKESGRRAEEQNHRYSESMKKLARQTAGC